MLEIFNDNDEVFAESKITGDVMAFETIMELWVTNEGPVFGLKQKNMQEQTPGWSPGPAPKQSSSL